MYSDREAPIGRDGYALAEGDFIMCNHKCCDGAISCLIDDGTGETYLEYTARIKREERNRKARERRALKKAEEAAIKAYEEENA